MTPSSILILVAAGGITATGATFWAVYDGHSRTKLTATVSAGALLVACSPALTLHLGFNDNPTLRGAMGMGFVLYLLGIAIFIASILFSRRAISAAAVIPMAALSLWTLVLLAVFSSGVA